MKIKRAYPPNLELENELQLEILKLLNSEKYQHTPMLLLHCLDIEMEKHESFNFIDKDSHYILFGNVFHGEEADQIQARREAFPDLSTGEYAVED